ncbi:MAG TPA: hypothetical protein VF779_20365 [Pyrinomonadaceae bacterium]
MKVEMRRMEKRGHRLGAALKFCALVALVCGIAGPASAQQGGQRPSRSLTSEDLLNRPAVYIPPTATTTVNVAPSSKVVRTVGATLYRDPAGAFTLSFPNGNWKINKRAGSIYNQRAFRRIDADGFASATANVYVLTDQANFSLLESARADTNSQREIAATIAAQFLSNNASLVSVEPLSLGARGGLRIIADQTIARRAVVRASINVFEQQGKVFVVVCCAPIEAFDSSLLEFEAITNSLASSAKRS